jgi:hypothetical protein
MKFSDVRPGMTVMFNTHDANRWAAFHEQFIRNPNYNDAEHWYRRMYRRLENVPLKVTSIVDAPGDSEYPNGIDIYRAMRVKTPDGTASSLSEHWFRPTDEDAFKQLNSAELREQIKMAPKPSAKKGKEILMGELLAVPGAKDYNEAAERFGTGRRTRRRRHRRHTRRR